MQALYKIIKDQVDSFRDKYQLGMYCGNSIYKILTQIERYERLKIKFVGRPFKSEQLSGFIGYKHGSFVIVINTNMTLGTQVFTIAHEIYHLLQHREKIKECGIIDVKPDSKEINEKLADYFAVELLIPEQDFKEQVLRVMNETKQLDIINIIELQQLYFVDYVAITKRLLELKLITKKVYDELNKITNVPEELNALTKNLGFDPILNMNTQEFKLLHKDLEIVNKNYEKGHIDYDELVTIFHWLGCNPEYFGYKRYSEKSDEADAFVAELFE